MTSEGRNSTVESRTSVLVVDDDPQQCAILERHLGKAGHTVLTATSMRDAIGAFESARPDVVITDLYLGQDDGLRLVEAVHERDPDCPVLVITGHPEMTSAIEAVRLGVFAYLRKPLQLEQLVDRLSEALLLRKTVGLRNQALELAGLNDASIRSLDTLRDTFDEALSQLFMVYQPIVQVSNQTVYGYEALVRSKCKACPHPGALFDAAQRLQRIMDLGKEIRRLAPAPFPHGESLLFLNLHTQDLNDPTLLDPNSALAAMAQNTVLEITERASLDDVPDAISKIRALRDLGFRIAVDDLGAGYAGLTSFVTLEPDIVKLDMSLIRDVDTSTKKQKLVSALVEVCRDLGPMVVAEGVETTTERDTLLGLGCDLLQGYLYAKPSPEIPEVRW